MIRVVALTSGALDPSSRFRVRQHQLALRAHGFEIREHYPRLSRYAAPKDARFGFLWNAAKLGAQVPGLAATWRADLVWLQKELLPSRITLENAAKPPRVFDVDDAIWLHGKSRRDHTLRIASRCRLVIAGNEHIRQHFEAAGVQVQRVPTGIDTDRWRPREIDTARSGQLVIGWTGSQSTLPYLEAIAAPIERFLREDRTRKLLVVCNRRPHLPGVDPRQIEFRLWSATSEASSLQVVDVGLMPQPDIAWTQGKCSLKMLQYMATGIPTICSPVGHARDLLALDKVGLSADHDSAWLEAMRLLATSTRLRHELGSAARSTAVKHFSVPVVAAQLAGAFNEALP